MSDENATDLSRTQDIYNGIVFWAWTVGMPIVCLPGAFVTIASAVMFAKRLHITRHLNQSSKSLHTLLLGLSIFDFVVCIFSVVVYPGCSPCFQGDMVGQDSVYFGAGVPCFVSRTKHDPNLHTIDQCCRMSAITSVPSA